MTTLSTNTRILLIEDEETLASSLCQSLEMDGYHCAWVGTVEAGVTQLQQESYALLLLDLVLPDSRGLAAFNRIIEQYPSQAIVILTAHGSVEMAVQAIHRGAYDFVEKPISPTELLITVANALKRRQLTQQVEDLGVLLVDRYALSNIIGHDAGLKRVVAKVARLAASKIPVLITGESGTGKEVIARAIHFNSPRKNRPFVSLNCSAVPDNLLESELFGYEKGAFTGAVGMRIGKFERAQGGTIFLDEIGDMKLDLQSKLLRVVQEQEFERVGGSKIIQADVRVISATHQNLHTLMEKGLFREDLYYRLAAYPIHLPPLRKRREDIPALGLYFLQRFSAEEGKTITGFSEDSLEALEAYDWPGNVRELENKVRRAVVDCDGAIIRKVHIFPLSTGSGEFLPPPVIQTLPQFSGEPGKGVSKPGDLDFPQSLDSLPSLDEFEEKILRRTLFLARGNTALAANHLQVSRSTIYRKLEKYQISIDEFK